MLAYVGEGKLKKEHFPFDVLVVLQQRKDPELSESIRSIWGNLRQPEEDKSKRISEVSQILSGHSGNPEAGKELFQQVCGLCHVLHGAGRQIGPELTGYERSNLEFLLPAIIDPSLAVREEYELVTVTLRPKAGESEGALLTGFITAMEGGSVSIKDLAGNLTVLAETDIAERVHSPVSIMPEGLLDTLSAQQIADLFAYIQK
jgi:putative heme-binding domain-containing protein